MFNHYIEKKIPLKDGMWARFYSEHRGAEVEITVFDHNNMKVGEVKLPLGALHGGLAAMIDAL